jgi:hypothetical protein
MISSIHSRFETGIDYGSRVGVDSTGGRRGVIAKGITGARCSGIPQNATDPEYNEYISNALPMNVLMTDNN